MNKILILVFIILFLIGCSSTGFLMAKPKVLLYGQSYNAKAEDADIDIYSASLPNKEYIEIAQITCNDTEDDWNLKQILIKAREIGADGIIVIGESGTSSVGIPIGNMTYFVGENYGLKAIAIKYKENLAN